MKKLLFSCALSKNWWFSFCLLFFLGNFQCFGQSSDKALIADSLMIYPTIESMIDLPYFKNKVVLFDFWESNKGNIEEDLLCAYPTYLLVNKQGKVANFNIPRPSKKDFLYDEINRLLIEK